VEFISVCLNAKYSSLLPKSALVGKTIVEFSLLNIHGKKQI